MKRQISKIFCIGLLHFYMSGVGHAQMVVAAPTAEGLLGQVNVALGNATAQLTAINNGNAMSFLQQINTLADTLSKTSNLVGFLTVSATGGDMSSSFSWGGFTVKPKSPAASAPSESGTAKSQLAELKKITAKLPASNAADYSSVKANYNDYYAAKDDYFTTLTDMNAYIEESTKRLSSMYSLLNEATTVGDLTKIQGYVQAELVSQNNAHLAMQTRLRYTSELVDINANKLTASVTCSEFGNVC